MHSIRHRTHCLLSFRTWNFSVYCLWRQNFLVAWIGIRFHEFMRLSVRGRIISSEVSVRLSLQGSTVFYVLCSPLHANGKRTVLRKTSTSFTLRTAKILIDPFVCTRPRLKETSSPMEKTFLGAGTNYGTRPFWSGLSGRLYSWTPSASFMRISEAREW